jgi:hypothetical protein
MANSANTSALVSDAAGLSFNVAGCIALEDKTSGTSCAQALAPLQECDDAACLDCTMSGASSTDLQTCQQSAESGACASYVSSVDSLCAGESADGGAATPCSDPTTIVNLFCGTGS